VEAMDTTIPAQFCSSADISVHGKVFWVLPFAPRVSAQVDMACIVNGCVGAVIKDKDSRTLVYLQSPWELTILEPRVRTLDDFVCEVCNERWPKGPVIYGFRMRSLQRAVA
jgi:hypothetical protein